MINLLPPSVRNRYQLELVRRLVLFYTVGLLTIMLVFIGLLFGMKLYLSILTGAIEDSIGTFEKTPQYLALRGVETSVNIFNRRTQTFLGLYGQIIKTSKIFADLYGQLPAGIYINNISFDVAGQNLSINGFSASRDDILAFQKNLGSLSWVKGVNSPTSNILRETNNPFSLIISTNLKP